MDHSLVLLWPSFTAFLVLFIMFDMILVWLNTTKGKLRNICTLLIFLYYPRCLSLLDLLIFPYLSIFLYFFPRTITTVYLPNTFLYFPFLLSLPLFLSNEFLSYYCLVIIIIICFLYLYKRLSFLQSSKYLIFIPNIFNL